MKRKVLLSWSSGKDSAWALDLLRQDPNIELLGLLTTINEAAGRVAMHAVRETLLEAQAEASGLRLTKVYIPDPCSNAAYEAAMSKAMAEAKRAGVTAVAFGDLFLEDIRAYRQEKLAPIGIEPLFPLWGAETAVLSRRMVDAGLRAIVTSVDTKQMPSSFVGRVFDGSFLDDLPNGVDPCGERGEFHSFAFSGPMFSAAVSVKLGDIIERDGFVYADVLRA